jgi:hypothetical protein
MNHIFRGMWKNYDTEFQGILDSLRRHKELVERRASVTQYRRYQADMIEIKAQLDSRIEAEKLKKLVLIREWLAVGQQPADDHTIYQDIRKDYSTTAKWILDRDVVKQWIQDDVPAAPRKCKPYYPTHICLNPADTSAVLWMHGIPGAGVFSLPYIILPDSQSAGKTILASAIIDECRQANGFITSYFYCRDGDQNTNSAIGILKGLADQLLAQYGDLLIPSFYTRRHNSGDASLRSLDVAKKLLHDCCSIVPKLFLVVDGLDECEIVERKGAIESLTNLVGECNTIEPGKLRVLVVSQYYPDIQRLLQSCGATKLAPKIIQISETDNENDIRAYVKIWVDKIVSKNWPEENTSIEDMKEYLRSLTLVNAKGSDLITSA